MIFSPLAFGTVEAWSYAVMEVLIGLSALLLCLSARHKKIYHLPGLVPLILIAGYLLLQVIPLPPVLVRLLSPESYAIYHQSAGALDGSAWIPLSIYPRATFFELTRFLSYLVFYFVAVQFFSDYKRLKQTLAVIAVFAGVLSFLVIIQFITRQLSPDLPQDKILWIRLSEYAYRAIGPYVNRNHYAGLMEMIFPLMVCLFLVYRPGLGSPATTLKQRLRDFLLHPRVNYHFLYGLSALLIGTSVFVSLSRGGIMSLTLSMGALSIWLMKKAGNWKAGLITLALFTGILVLTGSNGWDRIFERFGDVYTEAGELNTGRPHYWQDGMTITRHFPLTGSGIGTWQEVYPRFRTFPGNRRLEHAHSDYIEFLATGGIVLVGLMGLALFRIILYCFRYYQKRRRRMAIYLFAGSLAAVMSILLHSFVDFNLQVGANGLYFFLVLAVMASGAHTRFGGNSRATYLPEATIKPGPVRLIAAVFFIAMLVAHGGVLKANYHVHDFSDTSLSADMPEQDMDTIQRAYERAAAADPLNAKYHLAAANTSVMLGETESARYHYQRAVRLAPLNVRTLQDAGRFFARQGNMDVAGPLLRAAMEVSHNHISAYLNYAAALFENNRSNEALAVLTEAMMDDPGNTDTCLALMAWVGLADKEMKQALPERAVSYLAFGDYLASLGRYQKAGAAYRQALTYVDREELVQKEFFVRVYRFYKSQKEEAKARDVIQQALEYFPEDKKLQRILKTLS